MKEKKSHILLIVESPAKIKTINKLLGQQFKVLSTKGHVKDLPEKEIGISIVDCKVSLSYVTLEKKDTVLKEICKAAKQADTILLGPDPDREGEIIAWHVEQELIAAGIPEKAIKRITFNEITKAALLHAIEHTGAVDMAKVGAQQARRGLDRIVGYEVSPILSRKFRKGLSAGRVQSVALRLICDRDQEIAQFVPQESWSIDAVGATAKATLPLSVTHVNQKKIALKTEAEAKKAVEKVSAAKLSIESIVDSVRSKRPVAPFITSTLQQAAAQQLHFKVAKTMEIAQKLYEGIPLEDSQTPVALITYMRTDSTRISDTAIKEVRSFIEKTYGAPYLPEKLNVFAKKKKGQDAHEAIRPVDVRITPEQVAPYLDAPLAKLYGLIWRRFVACQMSDATFAQRKVTVSGDGVTLSAVGTTPIFDGFLKLYRSPDDEEEESRALSDTLAQGQAVTLNSITPKQHFTQPPARFSEATLVKELEKEGIGRPSTYATILKTIQARAYTELDDKKRFAPTDLGKMVTKLLVEHLPKIMSISFTAEMEEKLDKVAQAELERDQLLCDFYEPFMKDVAQFRTELGSKPLETTTLQCPSCKEATLVIRFGKAGPFAGCPRYPDCTFTSNFKRKDDGTIELVEQKEIELRSETCPQCGKQLRDVVGRFGPFIACSGYPECTYIHQTFASFPCPDCGSKIARRTWKGKVFWGCTGYPKCKYSIAGDISDERCPLCNAVYLKKYQSKDGKVTYSCVAQGCTYTRSE